MQPRCSQLLTLQDTSSFCRGKAKWSVSPSRLLCETRIDRRLQRLAKWFMTLSPKDKAKIVKDVSQLVLARRTRMCNFLEYKDTRVVYRRYASLFFIAGCDSTDNELITLEIVHRYVEQMDKYYGNVCELDIIFNFQKAYFILDELLLAGEMQESSKKNVLRCIGQQDNFEDMEVGALFISCLLFRCFALDAVRRACSTQLISLFPLQAEDEGVTKLM